MATATTTIVPTTEQAGLNLVKRYMWISAGVGLIPLPALDAAALIALQLKMLKDLTNLYPDIHFSEQLGKASITALLGASAPIAGSGLGYMLRALPVVGPAISLVTIPAFSGASTYAVGKVFIMHFESGGTLLDFDPSKMRAHYLAALDRPPAKASAKS